MPSVTRHFAVNTYSYTFDFEAAACIRHLGEQGWPELELMMYPGHLWPGADPAGVRRALDETGMRLVSVNMPNIDLNIGGATAEMRAYSLGLLERFIDLAGEIGAPALILGPGKANPLFPAPREVMEGHFFAALDRLGPRARAAGVRILVENMPVAFIPDAEGLMATLERYGDDGIGVIYDVANGHFIGESLAPALRRVAPRLGMVHASDTGQRVYRHDTVGAGDVPFAEVPPVLAELGFADLPVLEVISPQADPDILNSAERLAAMGWAPS